MVDVLVATPLLCDTLIYVSGIFHADASCDFDQDLCGWQNDNFDDFDWSRMKGSTATPNTGPRADHTSSTGGSLSNIYQ